MVLSRILEKGIVLKEWLLCICTYMKHVSQCCGGCYFDNCCSTCDLCAICAAVLCANILNDISTTAYNLSGEFVRVLPPRSKLC